MPGVVTVTCFVAVLAMHGLTYPVPHLAHLTGENTTAVAGHVVEMLATGADHLDATARRASDARSTRESGPSTPAVVMALCAAAVVAAATALARPAARRARPPRTSAAPPVRLFGPDPPVPRPLPVW